MLYIANLIQSIGVMNFIVRLVVLLCTLFLIGVIFMGLAFLFGF